MVNIAIGIVLLIATVLLFMWAVPRGGQPSRVPEKWGLGTAVPLVILCLGVAGCLFIAKGFFP